MDDIGTETCICDEGELCRVCVDPRLHQLVYLRLGAPWRQAEAEVQYATTPLEWLALTAGAN